MFYRILVDNFKHPHTGKPMKKGEIVDLFHTQGDKLTEGENPPLVRTKKVDAKTAMVMQEEIKKELGN